MDNLIREALHALAADCLSKAAVEAKCGCHDAAIAHLDRAWDCYKQIKAAPQGWTHAETETPQ